MSSPPQGHPQAARISQQLLVALREHMALQPGGLETTAWKLGWNEEEELDTWLTRALPGISLIDVITAWQLVWEASSTRARALPGLDGSIASRRESAVSSGLDEIAEVGEKGALRDFLIELIARLAESGTISREGTITDLRSLIERLRVSSASEPSSQ